MYIPFSVLPNSKLLSKGEAKDFRFDQIVASIYWAVEGVRFAIVWTTPIGDHTRDSGTVGRYVK